MRVELRRSGGFAATTRLHAVVVDTIQVPPDRATVVDQRVDAARASAAWGRPAPVQTGADLLHYTVSIAAGPGDDGPRMETVTFDDPIPDAALAALVDIVLELGKEQG
jgi:hypothetical protein